MKKILIILAVALLILVAATNSAKAAPVSWDGNVGTGILQPLQSLWGAIVKMSTFQATSTTATSTIAGGFAVDTSGLVYDWNTNMVGIGTAAPVSALHIDGAASTLVTIEGGASNSPGILFNQTTTNKAFMRYIDNGASTDNLELQSDGNVYLNPVSNVGVGSSTPTAKLSVMNTLGGTTPLFTVASSTSGLGTSTVFNITSSGGVIAGGTNPRAGVAFTVGGTQTGNGSIEFIMGSGATIQCLNAVTLAYCSTTYDTSTVSFRSGATSGTLQTFRSVGSPTLVAATVGAAFDYSTGVTNASQNFTGIALTSAAVTAASTNTLRGMTITPGAITNSAGATTYIGMDITMPAITQSAGTLTSTGLKITGGTVTSGTAYALTTDAAAGNVGIGTTTPIAAFTLMAASTTAGTAHDGYNGLVHIIAGLQNTTRKLFQVIDQWGHRMVQADTPTLSSCGSSTIAPGSTDTTGVIVLSGVLLTSCQVDFAHPYPTTAQIVPVVSTNTTSAFADVAATSTASFTVGLSAGLNSGYIYYQVEAYQP
jgi:hypothetical protein